MARVQLEHVTKLFPNGVRGVSNVTATVAGWTKENRCGLLNAVGLAGPLRFVLALVLLDGWMDPILDRAKTFVERAVHHAAKHDERELAEALEEVLSRAVECERVKESLAERVRQVDAMQAAVDAAKE